MFYLSETHGDMASWSWHGDQVLGQNKLYWQLSTCMFVCYVRMINIASDQLKSFSKLLRLKLHGNISCIFFKFYFIYKNENNECFLWNWKHRTWKKFNVLCLKEFVFGLHISSYSWVWSQAKMQPCVNLKCFTQLRFCLHSFRNMFHLCIEAFKIFNNQFVEPMIDFSNWSKKAVLRAQTLISIQRILELF